MDDTKKIVPLSQEDIGFIKRKLRTANKVTMFFIVAFIIIGLIWAYNSGYYQPLVLAGGFILITLLIWLYVSKSNNKELKNNSKIVYKGKIKKASTRYETGSRQTNDGVYINQEYIPGLELYATYADNDEVEVHISEVKKYILKKQLIKGTGNLEYKIMRNEVDIPEDTETTSPLNGEELACMKDIYNKRKKYTLLGLLIVPVCMGILEWFFVYVQMTYAPELWNVRISVWSALLIVSYFIWYMVVIRSGKDMKNGQKIIIHTLLIDKERIAYNKNIEYYLKTSKKKYEVTRDCFNTFENHEKIEIHFTQFRRAIIQIVSLSVKEKIYRNEKFFRNFAAYQPPKE